MPIEWRADDDFSRVVDTLESVVIERSGCTGPVYEGLAWRFREVVDDHNTDRGDVERVDTTWQAPVTAGAPPRPGDRVRDASGRCAAVRQVTRLQGDTRYVVVARRCRVTPARGRRYGVETPVVDATPEGPVVLGWRAKPRPLVGVPMSGATTGGDASGRVTIVTESTAGLAPGDRVTAPDGRRFLVAELREPDSIGELYRVVVDAE